MTPSKTVEYPIQFSAMKLKTQAPRTTRAPQTTPKLPEDHQKLSPKKVLQFSTDDGVEATRQDIKNFLCFSTD